MKLFLKLSACIAPTVAYILLLTIYPFCVPTFLLGVPVCCMLTSLIHELGHLLAYFLLKLEWKRLVLSCFVWEAGKGLRLDGNRRIWEAACTCAYRPEVPFWRYGIALLSGGILVGAFGIGAICLSFAVADGFAAFLQCLGVVGVFNAAFNLLLPYSTDRSLFHQIKNARTEG